MNIETLNISSSKAVLKALYSMRRNRKHADTEGEPHQMVYIFRYLHVFCLFIEARHSHWLVAAQAQRMAGGLSAGLPGVVANDKYRSRDTVSPDNDYMDSPVVHGMHTGMSGWS
jgi:hypothetical protein